MYGTRRGTREGLFASSEAGRGLEGGRILKGHAKHVLGKRVSSSVDFCNK